MMPTKYNKEKPSYILQSFLKLFSMFKISIFYETNNVHKILQDALGIKYIKCDKVVGRKLENKPIDDVITVFVKNVLLCRVGLSWII